MILGESPFLSESTRDNSQIIGEEKSMQAFLISKKKLFPVNRITKQRRQVTGKMATMRPRGSVHKKVALLSVERSSWMEVFCFLYGVGIEELPKRWIS